MFWFICTVPLQNFMCKNSKLDTKCRISRVKNKTGCSLSAICVHRETILPTLPRWWWVCVFK